jgi:general secretion pathway protein C
MKSRTILNFGLFFSISLAVASSLGFAVNFIVKDSQVFVPIGKSYYKGDDESLKTEKESFYFGKDSSSVASNNIFDSAMRSITLTESKMGTVNENDSVPEVNRGDILFYFENPGKCPAMSGMEISGTVVADEMDKSVAILKDGKGRNAGVYITQVGSVVKENITLELVWRNFVILKTAGGIKCIGEGVGDSKAEAVESPVASGVQTKEADEGLEVRKVGENQYVIKRSDLMKLTGNLNSLARQARIIPARNENGFKIFSIKQNSLYRKIGIVNGDVIKSINGIELSSPDKALEAYSRLQSASKLSLDIKRGGKNETLEYTIE